MGRFTVIVRAARAPFLLLTPICVLLGAAPAMARGSAIDPVLLALVFAGALLAHSGVNLLNEYFDFRSGLDLQTRRTPFSGGSGALPAHPEAAQSVLLAGCIAVLLVVLIGVTLMLRTGPGLLPLGAVGILIVVIYTTVINRWPFVCLVAPGLGFGVLMVIGTHYVLTAGYTDAPWLAAAVPFLLTNNLLLLNQYPDLEADAAAGRRHFPLVYGLRAANIVYGIFLLASAAVIVSGVIAGSFPVAGLVALLPLPLAVFAWSGAARHLGDLGRHPQYLAANVATALLVPLLLALAIIYGDGYA